MAYISKGIRKRQILANQILDDMTTVGELLAKTKDDKAIIALDRLHLLLMWEYQIITGEIR